MGPGMPSGRAHRAFSEFALKEDGAEVHRVIDSTAAIHGPSHRGDPVHSVQGVVTELAKRGQLQPLSAAHAALHVGLDRGVSAVANRLPRGPMRKLVKGVLEDAIVQMSKRRKR